MDACLYVTEKNFWILHLIVLALLLYNYPTPKITSPFYEGSNKQLQEEKEN